VPPQTNRAPDIGASPPDAPSLSAPEPDPTPNDSTPIWDLVIADMRERDAEGRRKYGTRLQAGNGRDPLVDAYQEALDLAVYLRQAIEERRLAQTRPANGRWSAEEDDSALAMAGEGWSLRRIAERLDRTPDAVAARLSRLRRAGQP